MKRTWLILVSALLISACSETGTPAGAGGGGTGGGGTGGSGAGGEGGTGGIAFSYPLLDCDSLVPEFCGYPFPSNVYTVEDADTASGRKVQFGDEFLRNNDSIPWDYSDGFSAGTPILTYLPAASGDELGGQGDIEQSLSESSPSILLDVQTGELVPHFAEIDSRSRTPEQRSTMIRPVVRLRDDARYIVALRNLTNDDGDVIEASEAFASLRDDTPSEDESVEARRPLYENMFAKLEAKGWARNDIQIAWDFNTASDENNTQWMLRMRDTAFELIEQDGGFKYTINPDGVQPDPNPDIAFRILGTFKVPLFMTSPEPGSLLVLDEDDMPMVNPDTPWADIPFEVRIPVSARTSPAAIVEYGHGLFGTAGQIGAGHFQTFMNEYNYAFVATNLQGMSDPDQQVVEDALLTGKFSATHTLWDRLHQGFLNHLVLLRMMKTAFAEDETYGQYLKGDEAYYYGISQGGIMGTVILGLSDDIERGALGVPGMPYSLLVFRSVDFDIFLTAIRIFYPDYRMNQLLIGMAQMLWDRVEPTGYTHHISENPLPGVNPKEVLMRAAVADWQVTTLGAHIMARTLNAPHLDSGLQGAAIRDNPWGLPTVTDTASGNFLMEYDFGLPGEPQCNVPMSLCDDPHGDLRQREAARKQLDAFFKNGTGANYCLMDDPNDEHDAVADGVCSFPSLAECEMGETEEDTQALCIPEPL